MNTASALSSRTSVHQTDGIQRGTLRDVQTLVTILFLLKVCTCNKYTGVTHSPLIRAYLCFAFVHLFVCYMCSYLFKQYYGIPCNTIQ